MPPSYRGKSRAGIPLPERYGISGSEDSEQIRLFMWAALPDTQKLYPELRWMFAIPNGGFRHKREGGKLKAMGVKAGVPDIMLPIRRGKWPGIVIELKRPTIKAKKQRAGEVRENQKPWIIHFLSQGYGAVVCVGWEPARDVLIEYLKNGANYE